MLNNVTIMGRLVADPDFRTTPSGVSVTTIRIACERDFKDKETGVREADFLNVVAWKNTAEFIARNFSKSSIIVVNGRIQIRPYTDKEGNKRTATEIIAENVYFGDSKKKDNSEVAENVDDNTDDCPF